MGSAMTQDARRPLHRLTPLVDDPVSGWLSRPQTLRVAMTGWFRWGLFALLWLFIWISCLILLPGMIMPTIIAFSAGAALVWPWRRMTLRARSATAATLIRSSAPAESIPVDD